MEPQITEKSTSGAFGLPIAIVTRLFATKATSE